MEKFFHSSHSEDETENFSPFLSGEMAEMKNEWQQLEPELLYESPFFYNFQEETVLPVDEEWEMEQEEWEYEDEMEEEDEWEEEYYEEHSEPHVYNEIELDNEQLEDYVETDEEWETGQEEEYEGSLESYVENEEQEMEEETKWEQPYRDNEELSNWEQEPQESEVKGEIELSTEDYIKWVQRSLNRILNIKLKVDGKINTNYRTALTTFNKRYLNDRDYNDIDERTQNQVIKLNEQNRFYLKWAQAALKTILSKSDLGISGQKDTKTTEYLKEFQKQYSNLKIDGFIGAKTELALIKAFGKKPPEKIYIEKITYKNIDWNKNEEDALFNIFLSKFGEILFSNSNEINSFFKKETGFEFCEWFRRRIAKKGFFGYIPENTKYSGKKPRSPKNIPKNEETNFNKVFDNISLIFTGSASSGTNINIFQFFALVSIIINEHAGRFIVSFEKGNLPYLFNYNLKNTKNGIAYNLLNNQTFMNAHRHRGNTPERPYSNNWKLGGEKNYPSSAPRSVDKGGIISEMDFCKFRGRGLTQISFRGAYLWLIKYIIKEYRGGNDIINHFRSQYARHNDDFSEIANLSSNAEWNNLFLNTDYEFACIALFVFQRAKRNFLNLTVDSNILKNESINEKDRGSLFQVGYLQGGTEYYGHTVKKRVMQMMEALKKDSISALSNKIENQSEFWEYEASPDGCTALPGNMRLAFSSTNGWLREKNTINAPFRYICQIETTYEVDSKKTITMYGSGVLIGNKHVLTAAHVIKPFNNYKLKSAIVSAALNNEIYPFGRTLVHKVFYAKNYIPPSPPSVNASEVSNIDFINDYAVLVTKDEIGAGYWGQENLKLDSLGTSIGAIKSFRAGKYKVNIGGYPGIKNSVELWRSFDETVSSHGLPEELLFVRNKLCQGQSGSPIWVNRSSDNGGRNLVAIFVGWKFLPNKQAQPCGRLIDDTILRFIEKIKARYSDS